MSGRLLTRGRAELLVAVLLVAVTVPLSPHGSVPQWDDLVLGLFTASLAWRIARTLRRMEPGARLPWQVLGLATGLFSVASLITGLTHSGFGDAGPGDVLLLVASFCPPVTCVLLARRVHGRRWLPLVLDGLAVTTALLVTADVVLFTPALGPDGVSGAVGATLVGYGSYAALTIGLAAALCTVSAAVLRRSATGVLATTAFFGLSASVQALYMVHPTGGWQLLTDLALLVALHFAGCAAEWAPATAPTGDSPESAPTIGLTGAVITVTAVVALPVTIVGQLLTGSSPSDLQSAGCAAVLLVLLARMALRIRDTGRMSEDLMRSEEDFRGLVESSSDGVAIVDADLRLLFTSPAARTLLGLGPDGGAHPALLDLLHEEDRSTVRAELDGAAGTTSPAFQLRVLPPTGDPRELEVTHHERPGSGRRVLHLRDVTTRRRRERELERMAYSDHLTGLPNRAMLFQELAEMTATDGERCLLVLDLDGFKAVNDTAGHEAGDQLLIEVARRLQGLTRSEDLVARLGGDEFAVLVTGDTDAAVEAAQRVVDSLARPYRVGDRTFVVGASVGLTGARPGGGQLAFREADAALGSAKQAGKGCFRVHSGDRASLAAATSDVAAALAAGEVQLRYEIVATSSTGAVTGAQSSPVWVHPELGLLPAAELWAAAERQGVTALLQQWQIQQACSEVADLDGELQVGIELPPGHVAADDLVGEVTAALATTGMAPRRVVLCFSEEVLQTSPAGLVPALATIRAAGVHLCLTDYGMGSTLWSQLSRVPISTVEVDVQSLAAPGDDERTLRVLSSIEQSCAAFDVYCVAGAVSTPELYTSIQERCTMAVKGPVLPSGLSAAQVGAVLRHPSRAALPAAVPQSIG